MNTQIESKNKVGLIVVSTGDYTKYLERFIKTFKVHFFKGEADLYIFTDKDLEYEEDNIHTIPIKHLGWPYMPLLRMKLIWEYRKHFKNEYLYMIDGDTYFHGAVGEEILTNRVAVLHRNIERKREAFNYEDRYQSTAYISKDEGEKYFIGGFIGGERDEFFKMTETISENIKKDIYNGMRAVWGDESHVNRYFIDKPPTKILSPQYMCPVGNTKFKAKVYHVDKDFKRVNLIDTKKRMVLADEEEEMLLNVKFEKDYNIFLSGSRGYIGKRLYAKLINNNHVGECDLKIEYAIGSLEKDIIYYDFSSKRDKYDFVYHLAAQSGVPESFEDPMYDAENNIIATLNAIHIANKNKARLIFTSSGATKGKAESPYGLSKQTCEKYIRMLCNDYVILRFSSIYGKKPKGVVDNFIRDEKCTIFGDGEAIRDFVNVDDIVECLIKAKDWKKGTYDCGSGKGTKIIDIANATEKEIVFNEERKGDKKEVVMENTTPNWKPKIDVIDYVKEKCQKK